MKYICSRANFDSRGRRVSYARKLEKLVSLSCLMIFLSACQGNVRESTDIQPGHSIVITRTYSELSSSPNRNEFMRTVFKRFDPPQPENTDLVFNGNALRMFARVRRRFEASEALPGKYHFQRFHIRTIEYFFEPHDPRYELEIKEGEAVYVGDIVVVHDGRNFRVEVREDIAMAKRYFRARFADSGLKFVTRKMVRARRLNPLLPR